MSLVTLLWQWARFGVPAQEMRFRTLYRWTQVLNTFLWLYSPGLLVFSVDDGWLLNSWDSLKCSACCQALSFCLSIHLLKITVFCSPLAHVFSWLRGEILEWDSCRTAMIKLLKTAFVTLFPPEGLRAICWGLLYTWGKQGRARHCAASQEQFGNGAQQFSRSGVVLLS